MGCPGRDRNDQRLTEEQVLRNNGLVLKERLSVVIGCRRGWKPGGVKCSIQWWASKSHGWVRRQCEGCWCCWWRWRWRGLSRGVAKKDSHFVFTLDSKHNIFLLPPPPLPPPPLPFALCPQGFVISCVAASHHHYLFNSPSPSLPLYPPLPPPSGNSYCCLPLYCV